MSKMLVEEPPILLSPTLAALLGINKAAVLQQLNYLLQETTRRQNQHNFADEHYWVYNTYEEWRTQHFKWLSISTLKNIFTELEAAGIIRSRQGIKNVFDRCKWYRIDYARLAEKLASPSDKKYPISRDKNCLIKETKSVPCEEPKIVLSQETKSVPCEEPKIVPSLSKTKENHKESTKNLAPVGDGAIFSRYWSILVKAKICEQVSRIPMLETQPEKPVEAKTQPATLLEAETPKPQSWRANDPQIQAAVAEAFGISAGGFAGTLALQLLGQNSGKNTRRDKFLIEPGMSSPAEIVLFGGWYRDHYEFSPKPSTDAERIAELVAEFRSKPAHFFTNNLPRAEAKLRKIMGLPDPILEQIPDDPEYAARVERVYARIAALKGSLV